MTLVLWPSQETGGVINVQYHPRSDNGGKVLWRLTLGPPTETLAAYFLAAEVIMVMPPTCRERAAHFLRMVFRATAKRSALLFADFSKSQARLPELTNLRLLAVQSCRWAFEHVS